MELLNNSNTEVFNYSLRELDHNSFNDNISNSNSSVSEFCEQSLTVKENEVVNTEAKHNFAQQGLDTGLHELDISQYDVDAEDKPITIKRRRLKKLLSKSTKKDTKTLNKFPMGTFKIKMPMGKGIVFQSQKKRVADEVKLDTSDDEENECADMGSLKRQWDNSPSPKNRNRRSQLSRIINPDYELLKLPLLEGGWVREIVKRGTPSATKKISDTYYYAPRTKKKMRSRVEVKKYLDEYPSTYTINNFSFAQIIVGVGEPHEVERDAFFVTKKGEGSSPKSRVNKNEVKVISIESSEAATIQRPKKRIKVEEATKLEAVLDSQVEVKSSTSEPSTSSCTDTINIVESDDTLSLEDFLTPTRYPSDSKLNFVCGFDANDKDYGLPPLKTTNSSHSNAQENGEKATIPIIQFWYEEVHREYVDVSQLNLGSVEVCGGVDGVDTTQNSIPIHVPKKNCVMPNIQSNTHNSTSNSLPINHNLSSTSTVFAKISHCTFPSYVTNSNIHPPVIKKRGRPRKDAEQVETPVLSCASKPGFMKPKLSSSLRSLGDIVLNDSSIAVVKRGRGRPRKTSPLSSSVNCNKEQNEPGNSKTKEGVVEGLDSEGLSYNSSGEDERKEEISPLLEITKNKGNIKSRFNLNKESVFPLFQLSSEATPVSLGRETPVEELITASSFNTFNVSGISSISEEEWGTFEDAEKNREIKRDF